MSIQKDLVLLFYPRTDAHNTYRNLPISMLKLASQVIASGYKVKVIDSRVEEDYEPILEKYASRTFCFGVSAMTGYQIIHGIRASKIIRQINPKIPVVWGGWHASLLPQETLQNDFIDGVAIGQGERILSELLTTLSAGRDFHNICGIAFKDKKGVLTSNPPRQFEDINNFASINFDAIDINMYINESELGKRTIFWNTSQGCSFRCGFCCTPIMYGRNWSSLSVERILREIEILINRFSIDSILFAEDNFFTSTERVGAVCAQIIKRKLRFRWSTDGRVDQLLRLSDDFFSLLKESGCQKIYIGAESGDQDVLNLIDKKIKKEDTYRVTDLLGKHKIKAELFLMVGFPLNPHKDLNETLSMIRMIKKKSPEPSGNPISLYPISRHKII